MFKANFTHLAECNVVHPATVIQMLGDNCDACMGDCERQKGHSCFDLHFSALAIGNFAATYQIITSVLGT